MNNKHKHNFSFNNKQTKNKQKEAVNEYVSQHKMAVVGFFPEIESYDGQRYISEVAGSLYESFTLGIVSTQDPKVVSQ